MARQSKTSHKSLASKRTVECHKCQTVTSKFRPTVINNRPVWVCEDC